MIFGRRFFIFALIVAALFPAGLTGCNSSATDEQVAPEQPPLVSSQIVRPKGALADPPFAGEVRGRHEAALGFRVPGKIIARHVDPGDRVKKGAPLMQVDAKDIKEAVFAAKAQLSAAKSQYSLAADQLGRFKALYKEDFMSKAELDRYQNGHDSARALLKQAKAQYTQAQNQLTYCNLNADDNGVILDVRAEAGQVVAAGMPVVIMVKGPLREVEIDVPENRVSAVQPGARFKLSFWALPDLTLAGSVRIVSPVADPVTRTYKARITITDPPDTVKLGMTATALPEKGRRDDHILIPVSAVYQTGDTPTVWVIENHKVRRQPVTLGDLAEDGRVTVSKGLSPGDQIVTAGVHKLMEGQAVRTEADK